MLKKNNLLLIFLAITSIVLVFIFKQPKAPGSFGAELLHHVTNDNAQVYLPIEIAGLDLSITKHVILIWAISGLIIFLTLLGTARYRNRKNPLPSKFSGLFEILIDFIRKDLVVPNIGKSHATRWTPLIATFFIFILFSNF